VPTHADGIEVVAAANGASTAAGAFHLASPVQAGAYQYLLYQGGSGGAANWYLRTDLDDGGSTKQVAYRPGVVGYTTTPSLNVDYGFSMLGTLQERVGDIASLAQQQYGHHDGIWGRIGGQSLDANGSNRFSADEHTYFAQFGKDWTLSQARTGGSTHTGVTVSIGSSSASFNDSARSINPSLSTSTGSVETQAQSVGGYWTKYLRDGSYFDSVGQLTRYGNHYSDIYGNGADQNGFGVALSEEAGKPFQIAATGVAVEPQAQLMYEYLKLNSFGDSVSRVSGTSTNALRGRIGMRLFRANMENASRTSAATPYLTVDVLHDFLAPGQTTIAGTTVDSAFGRTWYALGLGVSTSYGKAGELYADLKYARNLGGAYRRGVYGQVGYRYSW
jgi:outer membrane autotransporter protein